MKALSVKDLQCDGQVFQFEIEQKTLQCITCQSDKEARMLFRICGGMQEPQRGEVTVFGREFYRMETSERALFRRRNIGLAAMTDNLLAGLNLYENLVLSVQLDGRQADLWQVERLAEKADLAAVWETPAEEITCANQQKAAVIRAVLSGASLLLVCLDSAMDPETYRDVMHFVKYVQEEYNLTAVVFGKAPVM